MAMRPRRFLNATTMVLGVAAATLLDLRFGSDRALRFIVLLAVAVALVNAAITLVDRARLRRLRRATTDALTGAYNAAHLETCLGAAIAKRGSANLATGLVLVEVDHFTSITERLGDAVADRVLTAVCRCAHSRLRPGDTLFRRGGPQFVLLLPDTGPLEAAGLAEDLRRAIATAGILDQGTITASIGVSQVRGDDTPLEWIRRAATALRKARENGRDGVLATGSRGAAHLPTA
jgi:diguanylate cyclase (GGDEF)-like protein